MRFVVRSWPNDPGAPYPCLVLQTDNWNDYGYRTLFHAHLWTGAGSSIELGSVKILHKGAGQTILPAIFERLDSNEYCSLGQDLEYYRKLVGTPAQTRKLLLTALCDLVYNPKLQNRFKSDPAYKDSLLRWSTAGQALEDGRRVLGLDPQHAPASRFEFTFETKLKHATRPHRLPFIFDAEANPRRRIGVLIGPNGVGKTTVLANLAVCLSGAGLLEGGRSIRAEDVGTFEPTRPAVGTVVAVSFSAFDDFRRPVPGENDISRFSYKYVGNRAGGDDNRLLKPEELRDQFCTLIETARSGVATVRGIQVDRLDLARSSISRLFGASTADALTSDERARAHQTWAGMSSGQRIVVLVVAGLCANLDERGVVLCDEPETHLHPGLLSTLVAILEDLLDAFNAVAILGSHHPFILQQVPTDAILVLARDGNTPRVSRLTFQSFGEDLGELLEAALGLAEPERDWHQVLERLVGELKTEDAVSAVFKPRLGLAARTYLRSLTPKD